MPVFVESARLLYAFERREGETDVTMTDCELTTVQPLDFQSQQNGPSPERADSGTTE